VLAEAEWLDLAEQASGEEQARFDAAVARVRERLAMDDVTRAEQERRGLALAAEISQAAASRLDLCERIEALEGPAAAEPRRGADHLGRAHALARSGPR
jgi:hypothetical protein